MDEEEVMAYMIMLIVDNLDQLNAVLDAWEDIQVNDVTFLESTCFHRAGIQRPHIPMRFMFENLGQVREQCTLTLFAMVPDEATVHQCIAKAETALGGFDTAQNTMLTAWPLPIIKGVPKRPADGGED
jgi:hypothetical protein